MDALIANEAYFRESLEATARSNAAAIGQQLVGYDPRFKSGFQDAIARAAELIPQRDIAADFGIAPATVSRWVSGKSVPSQIARGAIVQRLRELLENLATRERRVA